MLERMKEFLNKNDMCVLATCSDNTPHTSLMAYVTDQKGEIVYMVTRRSTRKWQNMTRNPRVSLLVDNRAHRPALESSAVMALTVHGNCRSLEDEKMKAAVLEQIVKAHPHLSTLAYHPEAEVIAVVAESFLLLEGASRAHFETVPEAQNHVE
jgi:nitroimidazol reductase NimA-like FMN-containing flavoprotein (pyridoxamine 5'-phosphate oxidase superfamily)